MVSLLSVVPGRMVRSMEALKEGSEPLAPMRGETVTSGGDVSFLSRLLDSGTEWHIGLVRGGEKGAAETYCRFCCWNT